MSDSQYRRQALQLATQLPEGRDAALAVIEYLRQLVDNFVEPLPPDTGDQGGDLVLLRSNSAADGTSPRRRAKSSGSPSGLPK